MYGGLVVGEYIEGMAKRLKRLIYDCPYPEYDQQEVDYIIDVLRQHEKKNEEKIETSCLSISISHSNNKTMHL